jgi:uncharacterized membrane protein
VLLAFAAAALGRRMRQQQSARPLPLLLALLALWLVFLPNSCYLFTELRHFLTRVETHALWSRARSDPQVMVAFAIQAAVGFVYAVAGALTFGLAIRPLRRLLREAAPGALALEPLFFLLMAVGVYLGLVLRYNSWDLFTRPGVVLDAALRIAARPRLAAAVLVFAFWLWAVYWIVDVWIDGFALRWSRMREGEVSG